MAEDAGLELLSQQDYVPGFLDIISIVDQFKSLKPGTKVYPAKGLTFVLHRDRPLPGRDSQQGRLHQVGGRADKGPQRYDG